MFKTIKKKISERILIVNALKAKRSFVSKMTSINKNQYQELHNKWDI